MKYLLLVMLFPLLAQAAEPQVKVRSQLLPAQKVLVGGTVVLQIDLLVDTWFNAAPRLPKLSLEGAVVSGPSGEATHLNEQIDGKAFFGLRLSYQIIPEQAGGYDIPPLAIEVQPGQSSGPLTVHSQALHFVASQPAGSDQLQRLVASHVQFSQTLERSHTPLRVGDSVTRRLHVQAQAAQAMLIPPPEFAQIDGLKRYLQTPLVSELSDGRGGVSGGQREDAVTYVVTRTGRYQLPAIELQWWDAATAQPRTATVPALELEATGAATYQAPFSISDDLRALGQKAQVQVAGHWLLVLSALVLLAGVGCFGRRWAVALRNRWRLWSELREQARLASADYAWRQVAGQLSQDPPQLSALYVWYRRATGCREMRTASRPLPLAVSECLLAFFRSRYGSGPADPQATAEFAQVLPELRSAVDPPQRSSPDRHALKPLNP
ncbi:hypothetical protein WCE03_01280 [Pseudomonas guariconensis]|uniref:hypothetical protein n=1 Tax=Pseudomonas guariconensis TaxID=1288410 RepID=UPI0034D441BF